ncbi:P-loop containing nucleoside triphosphate hydrolase protein [Microdochium bolleyi]|uniref:p-loop containing nucleoside triphosphate hydrolase protein n=1 Tax=Microdochium bolleyi TaxID=196109 RepID=A0A136J2J1_9PEZI|nr:P-loop containing nucleoside triphosphate hydrolase protein [Microdochium bolleyi]
MASLEAAERVRAQLSELRVGETSAINVEAIEEKHEINPHTIRTGQPRPYTAEYHSLRPLRQQLPIYSKHQEFLDAYHSSQVLILSSDTGSGKTTQIPQFVFWDDFDDKGLIACTQPRSLAASSVAARVASEMDVGLGDEVGYSYRFESRRSVHTRILFLPASILLAESISDPTLSKYKCIIVDEVHERISSTDILLAILKQIVTAKVRPDLKIIIMSATLDTGKFQAYFGGASALHISARSFPVEVMHLKTPTKDVRDAAVQCVVSIHTTQPRTAGDILVFLPGENDIEYVIARVRKATKGLEVKSFSASLSLTEQQRILNASDKRRCIVSTNVAETSLTMDGIAFVVDSGLSKQMTYNPRADLDVIETRPISKASAQQRAGRVGRTREGKCYRLYTKQSFEEMRNFSVPGVLSNNVRDTVLGIYSRGMRLSTIGLVDLPHTESMISAIQDLVLMGFLDPTPGGGKVTFVGQCAARLPVDPLWFNVMKEAAPLGTGLNMISLAAISSSRQPILLSPGHPLSDHITLLNAFNAYLHAAGSNRVDMSLWCKQHFLNLRALEEVERIRVHLLTLITRAAEDYHDRVRKTVARGLHLHLAWNDGRDELYKTVRSCQHALVHPESVLVGLTAHPWVVYSNFTLTSKQYMDTVTVVDPEWIVDLPALSDEHLPKAYGDTPEAPRFKQPLIRAALHKVREIMTAREQI